MDIEFKVSIDELGSKSISTPTGCMDAKALFVAICGLPNVGKSSLLNSILNAKLSAVSQKAQTTRVGIKGVLTENNTQLVFVDSPGVVSNSTDDTQRNIATRAKQIASSHEICCIVIDTKKGIDEGTAKIIQMLQDGNKHILAVINKIDMVPQSILLPLGQKVFDMGFAKEIFYTSCKEIDKTKGVEALKKYLQSIAIPQTWCYPSNIKTDLSEDFLCSEIVREKLFRLLREELPYGLEVETEKIEDDGQKINVFVSILVLKPQYKRMVIGKGGQLLRHIAHVCSKQMEAVFNDKRVKLQLFVKHIKAK